VHFLDLLIYSKSILEEVQHFVALLEGGKAMATSKANQRAVNKYVKANYDRINVTMPKGRKDAIKAHADGRGESVNAYINRAIDGQMERDGAGEPQESVGTPTSAGVVSLPPEALETAQGAANRTGEAPAEFIARAINTQAQRDKVALQMGINPATREKLQYRKEGGTAHE